LSSINVGNPAEVTEPFLVSGISDACVVGEPVANNVSGDGTLADIDGGILEGGTFLPVGEELGATKRFTPNNLEGSSTDKGGVVGGGEGEFEGTLGSTGNEVGDVDLDCVLGTRGSVEDVHGLGDDTKGQESWFPGSIGVGGSEDSWSSGTTGECGLVDCDLWNGVGIVLNVQGDGVIVDDVDKKWGTGEGISGVGTGGEGLAV